jgi:general secretion pathway protein B
MSYILEALADSEQARQQVAVAPRHSLLQAVGEDLPRQRVWPYALAGAVLLNVAVLSLWQRQAPPEIAAPVKARPQAAPAVPPVAATAAPEPRVAPLAESVKPAVAVAEIVLRETTLPPTQPGRAEERRSARLPAPADAISGLVPAKSANDNAPIAMLKLSKPKTKAAPDAEPAVANAATPAAPDLPVAPTARASAVAPAAAASVAASTAPAPAAAPAQPAPAAAGGTELPPALLREMPALSVDGLIHGEGSSMVIVNNRLVREGDEVAPGVKLERIIGDNLVFNYKGYRFRR